MARRTKPGGRTPQTARSFVADTTDTLLSDVQAHTGKAARQPVFVDISAFTGKKRILEWHAPSVLEIYQIGQAVEILLKENVLWDNALAIDVATLAACHTAPTPTASTPIARFYAAIANDSNSEELFFMLMSRMRREFPHLTGANRDAKVIVDLLAKFYQKYPEQCPEMPGHIIEELRSINATREANAGALV